ncbi:MAG: hypothetical protein M1826_001116 [Phylliscum demangeonii]|nr:MAG: hypothetical protein M1826_001116 [Phylliscum demangeonii]
MSTPPPYQAAPSFSFSIPAWPPPTAYRSQTSVTRVPLNAADDDDDDPMIKGSMIGTPSTTSAGHAVPASRRGSRSSSRCRSTSTYSSVYRLPISDDEDNDEDEPDAAATRVSNATAPAANDDGHDLQHAERGARRGHSAALAGRSGLLWCASCGGPRDQATPTKPAKAISPPPLSTFERKKQPIERLIGNIEVQHPEELADLLLTLIERMTIAMNRMEIYTKKTTRRRRGLFTDLLVKMGPRIVRQWSWNPGLALASGVSPPPPARPPVGITHVVYKDGGVRMLAKVRLGAGAAARFVDCGRPSWCPDPVLYLPDLYAAPDRYSPDHTTTTITPPSDQHATHLLQRVAGPLIERHPSPPPPPPRAGRTLRWPPAAGKDGDGDGEGRAGDGTEAGPSVYPSVATVAAAISASAPECSERARPRVAVALLAARRRSLVDGCSRGREPVGEEGGMGCEMGRRE